VFAPSRAGGNSILSTVCTALLAVVALFWICQAIDLAYGVPKGLSVNGTPPLADADCPPVSVLFSARDEAEKLPGALETLLALDYPRCEIVAVDDRSEDSTPALLEAAAQKNSRLKVVRVNELPSGWLGKPYGLQQAYENSTGEWLVFTDADVHFAPDLLRRSVALAQQQNWDHMTLLGEVEMHTPGERIVLPFLALNVLFAVKPWRVSNPRSRLYAGVGSFQMVRRAAYEKAGTHRRLAMEVVDDMKLGKILKQSGARSGVAKAEKSIYLQWHSGVANIIRGTTKNFFAAAQFKLWFAILNIVALLLCYVFPWIALPFAHGWALAFAIAGVALPVALQAGVDVQFGISPLYALTTWLGAFAFSWMILRSTIVTLRQGGIYWRGTFYPLDELKRGVV
jgi:glycosyltransferase involved in cell wall biosynthesis